MAELRFEISEDLTKRMAELPVDWSMVLSAFIREKILEWRRLHSIVESSELTEKDALEIGKEINRGLAKKYKGLISSK